jgi:hypothetical protein
MGVYFMGVHLMGGYLLGVYFMGRDLISVYYMACHGRAISWACISFTSLPCASNTGGENTYIDTQDGWKASDCGRLGRQAAGHPWSALRVVKSCRKTAQRPRCCRS